LSIAIPRSFIETITVGGGDGGGPRLWSGGMKLVMEFLLVRDQMRCSIYDVHNLGVMTGGKLSEKGTFRRQMLSLFVVN